MQRIIQRYTEGGGVQPATNTGLPAGGNASSAIANYLLGPMSANATTLSYTGSGEGVPDYHALALEQKKLREAKMIADAAAGNYVAAVASSDNGGVNTAPVYNQSTDPATIIAQNEEDRLGIDPDRNESTFSGGGSDGVGNFGTFGDYVGGISDAFGFTDYAGTAAKNAADEKASNQNTMSNFSTNYGNEAGGLSTSKPKAKVEKVEDDYSYSYDSFGPFNSGGPIGYNMGGMKKPVGYNMGTMNGPIGYNMGGVSQVARSMLPEEQIQQRQLQQAQFAESKNPLAAIGNAMGMKVANTGMDAALGDKASKVALKAAMSQIPVVGPFLATLFG